MFSFTSGILMETVWLTSAKYHYLGTGSVLPLRENVEDNHRVQPTYTRTRASEWLLLAKRGYRTLEKHGWSKCYDENITEVKELVQKVMKLSVTGEIPITVSRMFVDNLKVLKKVWRWCWTFLLIPEIEMEQIIQSHFSLQQKCHQAHHHLWRNCSFAKTSLKTLCLSVN